MKRTAEKAFSTAAAKVQLKASAGSLIKSGLVSTEWMVRQLFLLSLFLDFTCTKSSHAVSTIRAGWAPQVGQNYWYIMVRLDPFHSFPFFWFWSLQTLQKNPFFFTRFMPSSGIDAKKNFLAGHIPGTQFFEIDHIKDRKNPLPHMFCTDEQFAEEVWRKSCIHFGAILFFHVFFFLLLVSFQSIAMVGWCSFARSARGWAFPPKTWWLCMTLQTLVGVLSKVDSLARSFFNFDWLNLTGIFSACRVWFNFRLMGIENVACLDGGYPIIAYTN